MRFPAPALLSAFLALATVTTNAAATEPPQVQVATDVQETYYDVYGATAAEIFDSIARRRLGASAGLSASGLTESQLSFTLTTSTSDGICELSAVDLRAAVTVTLPRHGAIDSLEPATQRRWEAYEALVEFHEYTHVEIEFQGLQELLEQLQAVPVEAVGGAEACHSFVEAAIATQTRRTRERHEAFHAREARAIHQEQAALRAEIEAIDADLRAARAEMDRLAREIAILDEDRAVLDAALAEITAEYGTVLPPELYDQAKEIEAEISHATDARNERVLTRNALVAPYNRQIEARRDVVARLSWTR